MKFDTFVYRTNLLSGLESVPQSNTSGKWPKKIEGWEIPNKTRMSANAQRDGRPVEYR